MLGRLSLKARLVLGVIVLSAIGLAAADVATYASLRSFLVARTDESLERLARGPGFDVRHACAGPRGGPARGSSPGDFFQVRSADGEPLCIRQEPEIGETTVPSPPQLPASVTAPSSFTTPAVDGSSRYRVRVETGRHGEAIVVATSLADVDATLRRLLVIMLLVTAAVLAALAALGLWVVRIGLPHGEAIVVATSLADVDATLRRLLLIMLLVTAAVLVALAALGLWVVRLGLRPLDAIGGTAAAIAGGDLSRRVERAEERTEVGRLGLALNAMLGQIESAFDAQRASERKLRRFVADASHELRTPLAAVRAYAELFARGAESRPDDLARSMRGIERESERMSVLVDDLLLLARLDEGRPLERGPVALDELVGEAVETAQAVEPDRPIRLETQPAAVLGDRDRLRQIVDNLLGNVRAHTPAGAPVSVRVASANGSAVVEVADSGPGLGAEETERVFERFYRADESRSRASGGVGLGLSIVAAVADAHGGTVGAESEPGRGTTFRITLPLATEGERHDR